MKIISINSKTAIFVILSNLLCSAAYALAALALLVMVLAVSSHLIMLMSNYQLLLTALALTALLSVYVFKRLEWGSAIKELFGLEARKLPEPAKFELHGLLLWKSRLEHDPAPTRLWPVLGAAGQLLAIAAICYGAAWLSKGAWDLRLDSARKQLQDKGVLVSMADLPVAADPGAGIFRQLTGLEYKSVTKDYPFKLPPSFNIWDDKTTAHAQLFAKDNAGILHGRIIPAIDKGVFNDPVDYRAAARDVNYQYPIYRNVVLAAHVLAFDAFRQAKLGQTRPAWDNVARMLKLAGHLSPNPWMTSNLVALLMHQNAAGTALNILAIRPQEAMPQPVKALFLSALERHISAAMVHSDIASAQDMITKAKNKYGEPLFGILLDITAVNALRMAPYEKYLRGNYAEASSKFEKIAIQANRHSFSGVYNTLSSLSKPPLWHLLPALFPNYNLLYGRELALRARIHALLLADALNQYKKSHGSYPDSLGMLPLAKERPELALNPVDGSSLAYQMEKDGRSGFRISASFPKELREKDTLIEFKSR